MRFSYGLVLTAASIALPAAALAIRPAPVDCGNVTEHGECDGAIVRYCDTSVMPNVLFSADCSGEFGMGALCVDDPNAAHPGCAAPIGGPCLRLNANGTRESIRCLGTTPACVEGPVASACTDVVGTCQATDIGMCRGDQLTLGCLESQPWLLDCPAFGATCQGGLCVGATDGHVCGPNVRCAAPLVCGRLSRCEAPPDAGVAIVDAATIEDSGSTSDASSPPPDGGFPPPDSGLPADAGDMNPDAAAPVPAAPDAAGAPPSDAGPSADAAVLDTAGATDCGCRTTGGSTPAGALLLLASALVLRARKRR